MRGTLTKKRGRWYVVLDLGRDTETGKRKRPWHGPYRTRKEAEAAQGEIVGRRTAGMYVAPTKETMAAFLREWIDTVRLRPTTEASYRVAVEKWIVPLLGQVPLQALDTPAVNRFYARLELQGGRAGTGLSPKSIRNCHVVLHRALRDAVQWQRVARNAADGAELPKVRRRPMQTWSAEEVGAFLRHVRSDRLYAGWRVLCTTGARRGELLGLTWDSLDLATSEMSITQALVVVDGRAVFSETKTGKSRRHVMLDAETVTALREHKRQQSGERLLAGPAWRNGRGLVFTTTLGDPFHPDSFADAFARHVSRAGLRKIRVHDVRHSVASIALRSGVPAKVVSELLGHSSVAVTLDVYSHVAPAMMADATSRVAGLIDASG
jgi:integrase